jgi:hypothetical protein
MKKAFKKLDKLMSLLFDLLLFYMFFVLGYIAIVVGIVYKPLGICGIIISVFILVLRNILHKNYEIDEEE